MAEYHQVRLWAMRAAVVAGFVLALARFIQYLYAIDNTDVRFENALAWWAVYVIGVGLLVAGFTGSMAKPDAVVTNVPTLLVGLVILAAMSSGPTGSVGFGGLFG